MDWLVPSSNPGHGRRIFLLANLVLKEEGTQALILESSGNNEQKNSFKLMINCLVTSRDRPVVRTLRCGCKNPGSNPGLGIILE